jgi:hypothetical protein
LSPQPGVFRRWEFVSGHRWFLSRYPAIPSPVSLNAIPNGLVTFPARTTRPAEA